MTDNNILNLFLHASLPVQLVMATLILISIMSWTLIAERKSAYKKFNNLIKIFEHKFWSVNDLGKLFESKTITGQNNQALENIFRSGFNEFLKLRKEVHNPDAIMQGTRRVMQTALAKEQAKLQKHLSFLATVGSASPYIGLFGTVWGIMNSFHGLAGANQATLAMVAPGISEALIATAFGLLAAIPAVIAYNRYANRANEMLTTCETFIEEFSTILHRSAYANS